MPMSFVSLNKRRSDIGSETLVEWSHPIWIHLEYDGSFKVCTPEQYLFFTVFIFVG